MKVSGKKKGLRDEAKRKMWLYYKENKNVLPSWIRECREEIITGIESGRDAADVFGDIIDRVGEELDRLNAA